MNDVLDNMGLDKPEEEKEVTEEEDPLKYFSQQQRKKSKDYHYKYRFGFTKTSSAKNILKHPKNIKNR